MFAYVVRSSYAMKKEDEARNAELFRRFTEAPGLVHAYRLHGTDGHDDAMIVTIWQNRKAAETYLKDHPLRREVDTTLSDVTRTMYEVWDSK